mmetsp:Transcript_10696/g.29737  ORF Transcript_10696/g.29737 Transcript_10696/m.29737 type:complete len:80 (+) Transcript_10696:48-287(+)
MSSSNTRVSCANKTEASAILAETAHSSYSDWYVPGKFTRCPPQYEDHGARRRDPQQVSRVEYRKYQQAALAFLAMSKPS